jgi:hypothetical protein
MATIVLPTDTRPAVWSTPNGIRAFHPHGRKRWSSDYRPNPTAWRSAETYSARLFVGFNVGQKTVYEMDDLVEIVRQVREQQTGNPSSSFVYQQGIYRHHSGEIVEEPGAQVIIINMDVSAEQFVDQMVELAETIAAEMSQEEVVVEIQRNGLVQEVLGVNAD